MDLLVGVGYNYETLPDRRSFLFRAEGVTGVFSGSYGRFSHEIEYTSCINFASAYDNNEEQNQLDALLAD